MVFAEAGTIRVAVYGKVDRIIDCMVPQAVSMLVIAMKAIRVLFIIIINYLDPAVQNPFQCLYVYFILKVTFFLYNFRYIQSYHSVSCLNIKTVHPNIIKLTAHALPVRSDFLEIRHLFSVKQFCFSICSAKSAFPRQNAEQTLKKD